MAIIKFAALTKSANNSRFAPLFQLLISLANGNI
jgi:hypothetical protein